jgi:O-antigen/teichoic acid export membrane protein
MVLAMKRFFIKYWWAFPILLTVSPLTLILSSHFLYSLDWSAKVPMLILYALIFLLSFIALFVSWIILFKNKQWWKVITSLLASIMTICALLFFLQPWLGIKATIATP